MTSNRTSQQDSSAERDSSTESSESKSGEAEPEEDSTGLKDLSHGERLGYMLQEAPATARTLRNEWEEDRIQFYFVLFSAGAAFAMLSIMLWGPTWLLYVTFAAYAIVVLPLLYIYEEETYFQRGAEAPSSEE